MTPRAFGMTILAALLAVLTLASSAWAACAWVLWAGNTVPATPPWWIPWTVKNPGREWLWVRGALTDSLKACRDEERRHHEVTDRMNRAQFSTAPDMTVCLPETMDPRASKGDGR